MMLRILYLTASLVLAAVAGILYYGQTVHADVVVAAHDLSVGSPIGDADIVLRSVPAAAVAPGMLTRLDQATGHYVAFPTLMGQVLTDRHVSRAPRGAAVIGGLAVPPGDRVISIPVGATAAVGGALAAGDLVDVLAIPDSTKTAPGALLDPAAATVLGQRVLVLGLRSVEGTTMNQDPQAPLTDSAHIGSVLVAISELDEQRWAAAIAVDNFVLTLVTG